MPTAPPRVCPSCRQPVAAGQPCPTCRPIRVADYHARVGNSETHGYDHRWRKRRRAYLATHPLCELCGRLAQVPDHYPISRRQLVADGVPDPDAWHRLRPLCIPCHNSETARR